MSKRNYTHIKELLPTIQVMVAEGMTQREIAEHFGFKSKKVVHEALTRARRNEKQIPKSRGRKPAKTLQEYKYEKCSGCWYISIQNVVLLYQLFCFTGLLLVKSWSRFWRKWSNFCAAVHRSFCRFLIFFDAVLVYFTIKHKYVKSAF